MATTFVLVLSIFADAENGATMSNFSLRIVSKPTPAKESLLKKTQKSVKSILDMFGLFHLDFIKKKDF